MAFRSQKGFSLVEMLIVVAVTGIIGTGILNLYIGSTRTYATQLQVTEAQQNVRAGLDAVVFDLRMAGFDPTGEAGAGFTDAGVDTVSFTADINEDGNLTEIDGGGNVVSDPNESITYSLYSSGGIQRLGRDSGSGNSPVAEYITTNGLGFAYAFDSDEDGALDVDGGGLIHWAIIGGNGNWWDLDGNGDGLITLADDTDDDGALNSIDTGIAADLEDIRAVRIWLLGQTPRPGQDYTNTNSYLVGNQILPPANDSRRRRLLTTALVCRNMGI